MRTPPPPPVFDSGRGNSGALSRGAWKGVCSSKEDLKKEDATTVCAATVDAVEQCAPHGAPHASQGDGEAAGRASA